jgi:hypothetical protein
MSIDSPEKRRQALDFGKIRGTGMPIPAGMTSTSARAHILNIYFEVVVPVVIFFWRNKNRLVSAWISKSAPSSSWQGKSAPSTSWRGKVTPLDGGTQEI